MRRDVLILSFNTGEDFEEERLVAELIADQCGGIEVVAVEVGGNLHATRGE